MSTTRYCDSGVFYIIPPALGIDDEVEALQLKGTKKKKAKKLDEDFIVRHFLILADTVLNPPVYSLK